MTIGILSAMNEEIETLVQELRPFPEATASTPGVAKHSDRGRRRYHHGLLFGVPVVLVYSRIGKVAAATTATHLILEHGVDEILFTGVAGSADPTLNIGDVVVGDALYQHDMDASPLFARHEIPLLGVDRIRTCPIRRPRLLKAARRFFQEDFNRHVPLSVQNDFKLGKPKAVEASIASGDKFFSLRSEKEELKRRLHDVFCVEMEGAAVAQVCFEYEIPFSVIRTISDTADEAAPIDFAKFIRFVASAYALGILEALFTDRRT